MKKIIILIIYGAFLSSGGQSLFVEKEGYTQADSLRGSLRKERNYDIRKYRLNITVDPTKKYIHGFNEIEFVPQQYLTCIQIDLFSNLQVDSIKYHNKKLKFHREYNAVFIDFDSVLKRKVRSKITFYYSGYPTVAKRAPWDGGFVFSKDNNGNDWVATACQGIGASIWWPNKDHQSDEPDEGMTIKVAVPNGLMNVSNGRFMGKTDLKNGYTRWDWQVTNPINNYDVALNIADYVHFGETYKGVDLDYYVLSYNLEKAKKQFDEVKIMMDCYQEKFGAYPFIEDGFKLVETPHSGMEHQSAIAYGNQYMMGYLGNDVSDTRIGMKWDFIIVHESGHEWFGNSITSFDIADMWIHEGFTTYATPVYIECRWGYEMAQQYINGTKPKVKNDRPIIGHYGVNSEGSKDMYLKASLMLNTLRHVVNNDELWWQVILAFSEHFKHRIVTTEEVVDFFSEQSKMDLTPIFDQYLRYTNIPVLALKQEKNNILFRWKADVINFSMPVEVSINGNAKRIYPTSDWNKLNNVQLSEVQVSTNKFYIAVNKQS